MVHISGFDRYLAKLWALPAVSLRDGEKQEEEEEVGAAVEAEEEPTSPEGVRFAFFVSSPLSLSFFSPLPSPERNFPLVPSKRNGEFVARKNVPVSCRTHFDYSITFIPLENEFI